MDDPRMATWWPYLADWEQADMLKTWNELEELEVEASVVRDRYKLIRSRASMRYSRHAPVFYAPADSL